MLHTEICGLQDIIVRVWFLIVLSYMFSPKICKVIVDFNMSGRNEFRRSNLWFWTTGSHCTQAFLCIGRKPLYRRMVLWTHAFVVSNLGEQAFILKKISQKKKVARGKKSLESSVVTSMPWPGSFYPKAIYAYKRKLKRLVCWSRLVGKERWWILATTDRTTGVLARRSGS